MGRPNRARRLATWSLVSALAATLPLSAAAQGMDPTPGTTPPIELDGTVGPGGDVPFDDATSTWQIDDALGEYGGGGQNLFHSFGRFNVPADQVARFTASNGLPDRVIARVTWGEATRIEGTLSSAIPGADLILLNPSGIQIDEGAVVDVQGSFYGTTATRLDLGPNDSFDATGGPAPLLAVDPPSSFGFVGQAAPILLRGRLGEALSVPEGETFALVGGSVSLAGDSTALYDSSGSRLALVATAPDVDVPFDLASFTPSELPPTSAVTISDARLQLRGSRVGSLLVRGGSLQVTDQTIVNMNHADPDPSGFAFAFDVDVSGAVELGAAARITVGTTNQGAIGDVRIRAGSLRIDGGAQLVGLATNAAPGPAIDIATAGGLQVAEGGLLVSESRGSGPGGPIQIAAADLSITEGGRILSEASGSAPGGAIDVRADTLRVSDAGFAVAGSSIVSLASTTDPGGVAGDIAVDAGLVELLDGGQLFSSTDGLADAGSVSVMADTVRVAGASVEPGSGALRRSGIEVRALPGSSGAAGRRTPDAVLGVAIEAGEMSVETGLVGTVTEGSGPAGDVAIGVDGTLTIDSSGVSLAEITSATLTGGGSGGELRVEAGALRMIDGGRISTSSAGSGAAGNITVEAGSIDVSGTSGLNVSGIFAETQAPDGGNAGSITLTARGDVRVADAAFVSTETLGNGNAGEVAIEADGRVVLEDGAIIDSRSVGGQSATGAPGSIRIEAGRGVFVRSGSQIRSSSLSGAPAGTVEIDAGPRLVVEGSTISTESLSDSSPGGGQITVVAEELVRLEDSAIDTSVIVGGGDGGDVRIDPDLVVLNRSRIFANALDGNGGRIFIRAGQFVQSTGSLVLATSTGGGLDGEVIIQSSGRCAGHRGGRAGRRVPGRGRPASGRLRGPGRR